jgi:hypothetical protein
MEVQLDALGLAHPMPRVWSSALCFARGAIGADRARKAGQLHWSRTALGVRVLSGWAAVSGRTYVYRGRRGRVIHDALASRRSGIDLSANRVGAAGRLVDVDP